MFFFVSFGFIMFLLLQNMSAQEMAKSVMNKSLIAIKEHGVCFEYMFFDEKLRRQHKIKFWVIGWDLIGFCVRKKAVICFFSGNFYTCRILENFMCVTKIQFRKT